MGREEARAKSWNTFRENMLQHAKEHPEFSLTDFIVQRVHGAYVFWREARTAERRRDHKKARDLYLKATESLTQAEKIIEHPGATAYAEQLKAEYFDFVVHRDPYYRQYAKYLLPVIKAEPGILQTDMYKRFNLPRPEITYTLYFAEKEGLVRREKKGRSYQLFFQREKPLDEPLLSIQDDKIDIQEKTEEEKSMKEGCRWFLSILFWSFALVGLGAAGGLFGAGFVVAAFIVWRIIRKIRHKKRQAAVAARSGTAATGMLPEKSNKNIENIENTP